jgi:hypothetical protein
MRAILCIALAGCSFPTKPGPPFGCVGDEIPDKAPQTVHLRGTVIDPVRDRLLSGATVTGFVIASTPLQTFSVTTDANGRFVGGEMTGGASHEQFVESDFPNYLPTFGFPPGPVAADIDTALQQIDEMELGELAAAGQLTLDPTKAFMFAVVVDCNDDGVAGATVTVTTPVTSDPIKVTYIGGGMPNADATHTDETGAAFVTGLTPGIATLHATLGDTPFRSHDVTTTMGALTIGEISP